MSSTDVLPSEIYRATPVGVALTRSLNTMLNSKQITGETALKIMVRIRIRFPSKRWKKIWFSRQLLYWGSGNTRSFILDSTRNRLTHRERDGIKSICIEFDFNSLLLQFSSITSIISRNGILYWVIKHSKAQFIFEQILLL